MATMPRSWRLVLVTGTAAAALTSACDVDTVRQDPGAAGTSRVGDPAAWYVAPAQNLQETSTSFTALVTRVACNSGVTGQVLPPAVRMTATEVIVTFKVAAKDQEFGLCQGNDKVPYDVELGEPVKGRPLVDGLCLSADRAVARSIFCAPGATRSPR